MPSEKQIEAAADQISEGLGAFLRKFCDSEASKRARYYLHEMPKDEWNQMALMLATEALTAAEQAEPARVKVKALEWEETHSGGFEADSALGYYKISMGFGSDAYYWAVTNPLGDDVGSAFEDPSYAKAAAQADYERRLLSALEQAEPAPAAEAVAWVAADTLNSPHPGCVSSLAYMSQIDKDTGREYVPLYTRPPESRLREALKEAEDAMRFVYTSCATFPQEPQHIQNAAWRRIVNALTKARAALKEASND